MSKFNLNVYRLALQLIPTCLRASKLKSLVRAAVAPIASLNDDYEDYMEDENYRIAHNGQVCYLQALLNDKFDPAARGIEIADGTSFDGLIIHARDEDEAVVVSIRSFAKFIYTFCRNFNGSTAVSFYVNVPSRLKNTVSKSAIKAMVDTYKVAGAKYQIIYIY